MSSTPQKIKCFGGILCPAHLLFLILWVLPVSMAAQDSLWTVPIDSITIKSTRLEFEASGTNTYAIKPIGLPSGASVGDALNESTPISFKQYGPAMLQSASARGTGAGHLGVNWNGINIQSMTHGQVDFSLIDISDRITYITGGNSAMDGSGNLGGVVQLDTKIRDQNGLHGSATAAVASFHQNKWNGNLRFSRPKWASFAEVIYKKGKNDFPFVNTASVGQPTQTQVNNAYRTLQLRQSNQWMLNKKNVIQIHYWWTDAHREIPPTMATANDQAHQSDQAHRLLAEWVHTPRPKMTIRTKVANITEQLTFQNQVIFSHTLTTKQIIDSRLAQKRGAHQMLAGLFQSHEKAFSDGYDQVHQRMTSALFLAEKIKLSPQWQIAAQTRLEAKDFHQFIPIYSLSAQYQWKHWQLKSKFGRHFHAPTFNDLFWMDLGVPHLKDEKGHQGELTINYTQKNQSNNFSASITGYWLSVKDWILWAPDAFSTWRPANSQKVISKGIESYITFQQEYKKLQFNGQIIYALTHSINKESRQPQLIGKQLLYVPKHKISGHLAIKYQNLQLVYQPIWIGKRPYLADNSKYMPGNFTQNLRLAYSPKIKSTTLQLHFSITNLADTRYQTIRYRPMPGRGLDAGISLAF